MGPRGPCRGNAAYKKRRTVDSGDGATDNAESTKALGRISRASEASGTRPCQTCDIQAEGAPGPHGGYRGAPGRRIGTPRKRGPCRLPGRAAGRESLRHDGSRQRQACRPTCGPERDRAGATEEAAARQPAKTDRKRNKQRATGAQPPTRTGAAFGRGTRPMRNRNRVWQGYTPADRGGT